MKLSKTIKKEIQSEQTYMIILGIPPRKRKEYLREMIGTCNRISGSYRVLDDAIDEAFNKNLRDQTAIDLIDKRINQYRQTTSINLSTLALETD